MALFFGILGATLIAASADAAASSSHGGGSQSGGDRGFCRFPVPAAVGGGFAWYGPPFYMTIGPQGPMVITPTMPGMVPVVVAPAAGAAPMPAPVARPARVVPVRARRSDPAKAEQLVTIGDRLFRAGNVKKASERFEQAARAAPDAASPRVRLAQVALVRNQFSEAAQQLRDAVAADPTWLTRAPNIESLYAEPADFQRQISKLESRVLTEPGDRDAWLVLGAQLFLSGQTRRSSDVFLRLTDRKPDPALAAFLEASTPMDRGEK